MSARKATPLPDLDTLFSSTGPSANGSNGSANGSASAPPAGGLDDGFLRGGSGVKNDTMRGILDLVNKLQRACAMAGDVRDGGGGGKGDMPSLWDALPSMVVVGGQSSGKSSVLESIVGRDFLPRGSGIVTRRPLVLQLVYSGGGGADGGGEEYGEFSHMLGRRFTDYNQIRNEIDNETNRSLGGGKAISPIPINLTITSPNVPNLTLVDMPGLTKVPIAGQPASIVRDIEEMARKFIEPENVIILAVSPANADLATSDAIRLASAVDPYGERTLGVLTKIDIMDRGTDATAILEGETFALKNGWVGVVNRSQHDINSNMSMADARRQELDFFRSSPSYSGLRNVGTEFLAEKCAAYLQRAVSRQLPVIQDFLDTSISKLNADLEEMGGAVEGTRGSMLHKILGMCSDFEKKFVGALESGKGGGENILNVFEVKLKRGIRSLPVTTQGIYSAEKVSRIILESDGYQPHLIAPEQGYRKLINQGLEMAKAPALAAVEEVHVILRAIVENAIKDSPALARFQNLRDDVRSTSLGALDGLRAESRGMVQTLVAMEGSYLTASYFKKIIQESQREPAGPPPPGVQNDPNRERIQEFERIGAQVASYVQHVLQVLETTIPKAIVHCQIIRAKQNLLEQMEQRLADKEVASLSALLSEDEAVMMRRKAISRRLSLLIESKAEVSKVL